MSSVWCIYDDMASLQKYRSGGRSYWRLVESYRENGKPKLKVLMHLGTADTLLNRLLEAPAEGLRVRSFEHGNVAVLKAIADRFGIVEIIDKHVGKSRRGLSVGTTVLLAALNRAVHPRSKRAWSSWAKGTSLHRLLPKLKTEELTSQYFWDQMNCIPLESLQAIEHDLTKKVVSELGLKLDTLFYDTTNFITYINDKNNRCTVARYGHSKERRSDLRIFGLALLVSREGHIPLLSRVYEGNRHDSKEFPETLNTIRKRLEKLGISLEGITIVYDKGNNSKANQQLIDEDLLGYVASLDISQYEDLLSIGTKDYQPIDSGPLEGMMTYRLTKTIWGVERTVVLQIDERIRREQIEIFECQLEKRIKELEQWKRNIEERSCMLTTTKRREKKIAELLKGPHINKVLRINYDEDSSTVRRADRLKFWIDQEAKDHLENEYFGKRMFITSRHNWSTEEIIKTYWGQSYIENSFRQLKDDQHFAVRPQFHWTDHKIHVHAFICMIALLLGRILEMEARSLGYAKSLSSLLDELARIRLAAVLKASRGKPGRPKCQWVIEGGEQSHVQLFSKFVSEKTVSYIHQPNA